MDFPRIFLPFEIKALAENGTFEGIASTATQDLGGEVVDRGAATKSLQQSKGRVFLLDYHAPHLRAGTAYISEVSNGLKTKGVLNLDKQLGRDLYADLKHYQQHGIDLGLSIGFLVLRDRWIGGVRHLQEIDLKEVSIVTWGMNPEALITNIKKRGPGMARRTTKAAQTAEPSTPPAPQETHEEKSFSDLYKRLKLMQARDSITQALWWSLEDSLAAGDEADIMGAVNQTLDEHRGAVIEWVQLARDVMSAKADESILELKAGAVLSSRNRKRIQDAVNALAALLKESDKQAKEDDEDEDEDEKGKKRDKAMDDDDEDDEDEDKKGKHPKKSLDGIAHPQTDPASQEHPTVPPGSPEPTHETSEDWKAVEATLASIGAEMKALFGGNGSGPERTE